MQRFAAIFVSTFLQISELTLIVNCSFNAAFCSGVFSLHFRCIFDKTFGSVDAAQIFAFTLPIHCSILAKSLRSERYDKKQRCFLNYVWYGIALHIIYGTQRSFFVKHFIVKLKLSVDIYKCRWKCPETEFTFVC